VELDRSLSNVPGIRVILDCVAGLLPAKIHFVLLCVRIKYIVGAHAEHLGEADQEMK